MRRGERGCACQNMAKKPWQGHTGRTSAVADAAVLPLTYFVERIVQCRVFPVINCLFVLRIP